MQYEEPRVARPFMIRFMWFTLAYGIFWCGVLTVVDFVHMKRLLLLYLPFPRPQCTTAILYCRHEFDKASPECSLLPSLPSPRLPMQLRRGIP